MKNRCVFLKLGSHKPRTSAPTNLKSDLKNITPKSVASDNTNVKQSVTAARKAPTITSIVTLKNHRVYIRRPDPTNIKPDDRADCTIRLSIEHTEEDGNISDASTVLYEDTRSPPSSPELIIGK